AASAKPPKKRKITGSANCSKASSNASTPVSVASSGTSTAVTLTWSASLTHSQATVATSARPEPARPSSAPSQSSSPAKSATPTSSRSVRLMSDPQRRRLPGEGRQRARLGHQLDQPIVGQATDARHRTLALDQPLEVAAAGRTHMQTVGADELGRHPALAICDRGRVDRHHLPAIGAVREAADRGHAAVATGERVIHRGGAYGERLRVVGRRYPVAGGTLQVVGYRPVVLVTE